MNPFPGSASTRTLPNSLTGIPTEREPKRDRPFPRAGRERKLILAHCVDAPINLAYHLRKITLMMARLDPAPIQMAGPVRVCASCSVSKNGRPP